MFCEDVVDCCLKVLCELCYAVARSSVDVDDGVDGVCFSLCLVDLKGDGCCMGDDNVEEADMY